MKNFIISLLLCIATSTVLSAQGFSLSTNVVDYAQLGTLNMEASVSLARHWTLNASAKYNPFTFERASEAQQMQARQRSVSVGTRFWPWHVYSGWWLAGKLQAQEYNVGGIKSPLTEEGERYGGGLSAGYTYMLHKHINIELGVGIWGGYNRYVGYACPSCGKITDTGEKVFFLPNDLLMSLIYVF